MGAWGHNAFANDGANDWAYSLEDASDLSLVEAAFAAVEDVGDDYLDQDVACQALAACEVVARCLGNAGYTNAYTEKVDKWVARQRPKPTPELVGRANATIERVLGAKSELCELWEDAGEAAAWRVTIVDLQRRIGFTATP